MGHKKVELEELKGRKINRLTVIGNEIKTKDKHRYVLCECECGNKKEIQISLLHRKKVHSCGCLLKKKAITHGLRYTRINDIYRHIKGRCYNAQDKEHYKLYGGRGIKMCDEWKNDFMAFYNWAMANGYNDTLTIDRIDVDGNYEPSNCRWVNRKKQANNRRSNVYITHNNQTKTVSEWADYIHMDYLTFWRRICKGMTIEKIINLPKRQPTRKIIQYDLNGNFIKEWDMIKQAALELGLHGSGISCCCKGKVNSCGGYKWKYKE